MGLGDFKYLIPLLSCSPGSRGDAHCFPPLDKILLFPPASPKVFIVFAFLQFPFDIRRCFVVGFCFAFTLLSALCGLMALISQSSWPFITSTSFSAPLSLVFQLQYVNPFDIIPLFFDVLFC